MAFTFGCGGSTPPEPEPAAPPAVEPPPAEPLPAPEPPSTAAPEADADAGAPPPAAPAFKDMNAAQKAEFMKTAVVPKMSELFKGWDAKEFKDGVSCVTCHGPGAKKGEFKMPNPKLPKIASFEAVMKKHPDAVKFMSEQVVPEMAKLLTEAPFDPATKTGFGCMRCHTAK
jgi:hypothetical protein